MLKKTKIITNAYWIVDSTYTVSYLDRCTSCNMSIDRPSRATLDKGRGGLNRNITEGVWFTCRIGLSNISEGNFFI